MPPRHAVRVLVCLAISLSLLVPAAWSGSADDPEVDDGCDDTDDPIDIERAWIPDPIWEHKEIVIDLCGDVDTDSASFREQAASEGQGWIFNWSDGTGQAWEIRVVAFHRTSKPNPAIPDYRQHTCRQEEELSRTDPAADDHPIPDGDRFRLDAPTGRFSVENLKIMEAIHADAGNYSRDSLPRDRGCGTGFTTVDRGPDQGFGDVYHLVEPERGTGAGVVVQTPTSRVVVPRGQNGTWNLNLTRDTFEDRNVTLEAATDAPVTFAFENRTLDLRGNRTEATTNVTVDVPYGTPKTSYPVTLQANATDGTGELAGVVRLDLNLTVLERLQKAEVVPETTIATVAPGNATTFRLRIDNVGTGSGLWNLSAEGPPAPWVEMSDPQIELDIEGSEEIAAEVRVPADAEVGAHDFAVVARSNASDYVASADLRVSVQEFVEGPADPSEALPGPGVAAVAAAAVVGAGLLRRRRR